jgi:hypothetical protein
MPESDPDLARQKGMLTKYLDLAHTLNPHFFKSIVKPQLVEDMDPPMYVSCGSVDEVYYHLNDCKHLFHQDKSLMRQIIARVGENPTF